MLKKLSLPLILFCVAAISTAQGAITFITDTSTSLVGTFSISNAASTSNSPVSFIHLPEGINSLMLERDAFEFPNRLLLRFGAVGIGTPNTPFVFGSLSRPLQDVSGYYDNSSSGSIVDFRIYNVADTGGATGTFSGNFEFTTRQVTNQVPDGGTTLGLLAASLACVMAFRRRR